MIISYCIWVQTVCVYGSVVDFTRYSGDSGRRSEMAQLYIPVCENAL